MIKSISNILTLYIVDRGIVKKEDYTVYRYGMQAGIEILLCFISGIIVSKIFNMLVESIVFFGVFIPLRTIAGGFHFKKFYVCYFFSIISQMVVLQIGQFNIINDCMECILLVLMLVVLYRVAMSNMINKCYNSDEINHYANHLKVFSFFIIIIMIIAILNETSYGNIIIATVILELISVIIERIELKCQKKQEIR